MLEVPLSPDHVKERLAASAAARRRASQEARVRHRRRRLVAGLFLVAVVAELVLAVSAYALPESRGRTCAAPVGVVITSKA